MQAANRGAGQTSSNEHFEESNVLPQMAVNRQHNMSGNSKRMGRMGLWALWASYISGDQAIWSTR